MTNLWEMYRRRRKRRRIEGGEGEGGGGGEGGSGRSGGGGGGSFPKISVPYHVLICKYQNTYSKNER